MKAKLSFFEIPAQKYERAVNFYKDVLEFSIKTYHCYDEIMGMIDSEPIDGAIFYKEGYEPGDKGIIISFTVSDIDVVLDKVSQHGGKVLMPKSKISADGVGYFALILDSEGNKIGLHSK